MENKVDNKEREPDAAEFFKLGFGEPVKISAISGRCIGDLLDRIVSDIGRISGEKKPEREIKTAVVGKPNVGKSSFVNALMQSPKMIVTDVPGTTRNSIDSLYMYDSDTPMVLSDTAGLRKRKQVSKLPERHAVFAATRALQRAHVAILLIDAEAGSAEQDAKIAGVNENSTNSSAALVQKRRMARI